MKIWDICAHLELVSRIFIKSSTNEIIWRKSLRNFVFSALGLFITYYLISNSIRGKIKSLKGHTWSAVRFPLLLPLLLVLPEPGVPDELSSAPWWSMVAANSGPTISLKSSRDSSVMGREECLKNCKLLSFIRGKLLREDMLYLAAQM